MQEQTRGARSSAKQYLRLDGKNDGQASGRLLVVGRRKGLFERHGLLDARRLDDRIGRRLVHLVERENLRRTLRIADEALQHGAAHTAGAKKNKTAKA